MKLMHINAVIISAVLTTACGDNTQNIVSLHKHISASITPTIVLPQAMQIDLNKTKSFVSGNDLCPREGLWDHSPTGSRCTVISEGRQSIPVEIASKDGVIKEDLKIIRNEGQIYLQRPSGSYVGKLPY